MPKNEQKPPSRYKKSGAHAAYAAHAIKLRASRAVDSKTTVVGSGSHSAAVVVRQRRMRMLRPSQGIDDVDRVLMMLMMLLVVVMMVVVVVGYVSNYADHVTLIMFMMPMMK